MKDDKLYLEHILIAIDEIKKFTADGDRSDRTLRAVERDIEIIGEAARNLSKLFRLNYPKIPWADIIGMRNKISHDYFGVDAAMVWLVAKEDIKELEAGIKTILKDLK